MSFFSSKTKEVETAVPVVQPSAQQFFADPAQELAARQLQDLYFNPEYGLIAQPIPIPIQQVAGLSPQEVQARNLAQGLGGFGQQLSEAQNLFRVAAQGFDPRSAGLFADPRARALYEQSTRGYDPRMGQQFIDQQARALQLDASRDIGRAQRGMGLEAFLAQQAMRAAGQAAGRESRIGQRAMGRAAQRIGGQIGGAQAGAMDAAQRARMQTQMAGQDLRSAGEMGRATALQGIAGLAGTGAQFDPSAISRFQDPFTQQVIDAQQAEIARLGEQQKIAARDQAVRAGAFGGSRGAIARAEIDRNILQQQAKTGAELRSQGFQQAQQAAEQAQARRQQAAQLTGSLGQAGAQTGISAAQQAANLGLSAEQLAQRGALEGGQLGLSGLTSQADIAQRAAQMGISAQELAGRLAQQRGALGLQAQQGIGGLAGQRADIARGIGSQFQSAQQLGSGIFGDQMARMQSAAAGLDRSTRGAFGDALTAFQARQQGARAGAQGIAGLGQQGFDMLTSQIGTLGGLGATGRAIQQRGLDAQYQAATQQADEPFMRMQRGFQVLGQAQPFMPRFQSGYSVGAQQNQAYQDPSTFSKITGALGSIASFFPSDIRLKENVMKVGDVQPGVGWYTWTWNDTAKAMGVDAPTEGVIAQELIKVDPSAVLMGEDGYYRVDYSKVDRGQKQA